LRFSRAANVNSRSDVSCGSRDSVNQSPTVDSNWSDSEELVVEAGPESPSAGGMDSGLASNFDSPRPPGLDGSQVVYHESDVWVCLHVTEFLALGEAATANVDRVLVGVVLKDDRHYVRASVDSGGQTPEAL
jgi:hypothetical protein